jgi:hypothetical protein
MKKHPAARLIFCMVAVFVVASGTSALDTATTRVDETSGRGAAYRGFGLNFGITLFYPSEVNEMIGDIYKDFKGGFDEYINTITPFLFYGISLKAKGVFCLNRRFALEPYGQVFVASKGIEFQLTPYYAYLYVFFFSGGVNCWVRFNPGKLVSFKAGAGGFAGYGRIEVDGAGRLSQSGPGFGGNLLAGIDVAFRKIVVNVDCSLPVGVINFYHRTGEIVLHDYSGSSTTRQEYTNYPERIWLLGFEIRPGVTFRF